MSSGATAAVAHHATLLFGSGLFAFPVIWLALMERDDRSEEEASVAGVLSRTAIFLVILLIAVAALFGGRAASVEAAADEAHAILDFVGLAGRALLPPQGLTIVDLRRLELARALATRARLLLLDEINTGLTASEMTEAIRLIQRVRDRGATILMVEHLVRLIMSVCDRIVVLDFGRKIAEGAPAEIGRNPEVIRAYLGR